MDEGDAEWDAGGVRTAGESGAESAADTAAMIPPRKMAEMMVAMDAVPFGVYE